MIKHSMDVNRQATQFLNPRQVPVLAMDAPLYALAKYIQWKWPQTHGEDQYVIMFEGLHIEMAVWLDCCTHPSRYCFLLNRRLLSPLLPSHKNTKSTSSQCCDLGQASRRCILVNW